MEQGRVRLDTHKIGYRYTDTESAEDFLNHDEPGHADTVVETDVAENTAVKIQSIAYAFR